MTGHQRVFLGHASEDKPKVQELYHQLKARGLSPWLDAMDLMPGQNWRVEIPNAIKQAGVFLACLSKQSLAKQSYAQREFRYALSKYAELPPDSIYLIPVRLDDCEVPDLRVPELELNLRDLHWVNLFEEEGFDRLVASIERALGKAALDDTSVDSRSKPSLAVPSEKEASASVHDATSPSQQDLRSSNGSSAVPAQRSAAKSKRSPTTTSRNPTIIAAWIGAAAVIVAGFLTSPWLADLFRQTDQDAERTAGGRADTAEPVVGAPNLSIASSIEDGQRFETIRDCDHDQCPEMILLPAGTFTMGSPDDENGRDGDEGPIRHIQISAPFAIGKSEVTFADYDHFAEETRSKMPNDQGWGRGDRPVINVSWFDARSYCAWLAEQTNQPYRLPSEAEWEYAARAGTQTPFSFGPTITDDQVNYNGNYPYGASKRGVDRRRTEPTANLPPNRWGLHDMHGNVWEWVEDWYHPSYVNAPVNERTWLSPRGTERALRGGSWGVEARSTRSASREAALPSKRSFDIGFRCVRGR